MKFKRQQGFLIPIALFIVVGIAALALAMSRFSSATFSSAIQERLSVQALYVAESAAQAGLHELAFDVNDPTVADSRCNSVDGQIINFTAATTKGCSAQLSCERSNSSASAVYVIASTANCGGGDLSVTRRVSLTAIL